MMLKFTSKKREKVQKKKNYEQKKKFTKNRYLNLYLMRLLRESSTNAFIYEKN